MESGRSEGGYFRSGALEDLRPRYLNETKTSESSQFGENLRVKYSRWKKQQTEKFEIWDKLSRCKEWKEPGGWPMPAQRAIMMGGKDQVTQVKFSSDGNSGLGKLDSCVTLRSGTRTADSQCYLFASYKDVLYLTGSPSVLHGQSS